MAIVKLRLAEGENLLHRLLQQGIELEHDCGGTLACATCRVIVREGLASLGEMSEDEQDMLDKGVLVRAECAPRLSGDRR